MNDQSSLDSKSRQLLDDGYIIRATKAILEMLGNQKITFFVLSEIYNWYPDLIREIAQAGHEIAWHTHSHAQVVNREKIEIEYHLAQDFIAEFQPVGFRAPLVNIHHECLSFLKDHKFIYDSSVYSEHSPQKINGIWEIPISSKNLSKQVEMPFQTKFNFNLLKHTLPLGSGLIFGLFGRAAIQNNPFVCILHPWQIITPPLSAADKIKKLIREPYFFPYLLNQHQLLQRILTNYQVTTMRDYVESLTVGNY